MAFTNAITRLSELVVDLLRTADAPNARWELASGGVANMLRGFTGDAGEGQPGLIEVQRQIASGSHIGMLSLLAPQFSASVGGSVNLQNGDDGGTGASIGSGGSNDVHLSVGQNATVAYAHIAGSGLGHFLVDGLPDGTLLDDGVTVGAGSKITGIAFGTFSGNTNASGLITVAHTLGVAPKLVLPNLTDSRYHAGATNYAAGSFGLFVRNIASAGAIVASSPVAGEWLAFI